MTSARPLGPDQVEALRTNLRSRFGADIAVDLAVDPDILGGLVVKVGSRMIDGSIRTISSLSTANLLANGGGRVAYGEGGKTYTWASSTGQSTVRIDTAPGQLFMAGGDMVFTIGPTVYRVGLD